MKKIDILAFAAHPDDVELACGGTIAKAISEGLTVVVVDMTRGEMGTRGNERIRQEEALAAAQILGVSYRENLELPDGNLKSKDEAIEKVVIAIRKYRPKVVLLNPEFDRHPDHESAHKIVRKAMFKSGLEKYVTEFEGKPQQKHRIRKMWTYLQSYEFKTKPSFFIDITNTVEKKMEAIRAYSSQVYIPGKAKTNESQTRLSRPEFLEELDARARYFGSIIGVKYAEAFLSIEPLEISNLKSLI